MLVSCANAPLMGKLNRPHFARVHLDSTNTTGARILPRKKHLRPVCTAQSLQVTIKQVHLRAVLCPHLSSREGLSLPTFSRRNSAKRPLTEFPQVNNLY